MSSQQITDPRGNGGVVASGGSQSFPYPASAAVAAQDLVALTCDTNGRVTVAPAGAANASHKCGVASAAAATGEMVQTIIQGLALVKAPASAPAIGAGVVVGTAGVIAGATVDATTVVGTVKGVVMSAEVGTSDRVWIWVY